MIAGAGGSRVPLGDGFGPPTDPGYSTAPISQGPTRDRPS